MIIRAKWHTAKRNVRQGDICLLQEADAFRADWKLCVVNEVYPDAKGNVRNVEVKVMPKQDGTSSYKPGQPNYLKRHVNHLILLVPVDDDHHPDVPVKAVPEVAQDLEESALRVMAVSSANKQGGTASQDTFGKQGQDQ